jgi:hypothetical protein
MDASSPPIVVTIPAGIDVHEAIGYCSIAARRAGMPATVCDDFIEEAVMAADSKGVARAWEVLHAWFELRPDG